eukprot:Gb_06475 [translate_table: standard]
MEHMHANTHCLLRHTEEKNEPNSKIYCMIVMVLKNPLRCSIKTMGSRLYKSGYKMLNNIIGYTWSRSKVIRYVLANIGGVHSLPPEESNVVHSHIYCKVEGLEVSSKVPCIRTLREVTVFLPGSIILTQDLRNQTCKLYIVYPIYHRTMGVLCDCMALNVLCKIKVVDSILGAHNQILLVAAAKLCRASWSCLYDDTSTADSFPCETSNRKQMMSKAGTFNWLHTKPAPFGCSCKAVPSFLVLTAR